jgi:carboxyl-terminal processing protease
MALLLGCCLAFGMHQMPRAFARERGGDGNLFEELKVFTDVLAIVERDYVRPVNNKQIVEGAIKGLLATLDPHSGYLDPDFYQDLQVQTKGEFGGLGIEITIKEGALVVVAPMEGSPAEQAGVRPGDVIVKIDNKFTKEFSLVDAVKRLRGPKGSSIAISLQRKGFQDLVEVTLVRDNIQVRSVKSRMLSDGYVFVRINQFVEKTGDDLRAAIKRLHDALPSQEIKGMVLDLRNNPGGLLNQAVSVSDLFLSEGIIVYTDGRIESQKQRYFAHARGTEPYYPIVALVNGGSASAAEIVAGALKDHGRALVLGTQTFGKGSVQTITPLENGGALTLTTALYYLKSGRSIQALGVTPDIEMDLSPTKVPTPIPGEERGPVMSIHEGDLPGAIANPQSDRESDRESGIEQGDNALKKINKTPPARTPVNAEGLPLDLEKVDLDTLLKADVQVNRALEILKNWH